MIDPRGEYCDGCAGGLGHAGIERHRRWNACRSDTLDMTYRSKSERVPVINHEAHSHQSRLCLGMHGLGLSDWDLSMREIRADLDCIASILRVRGAGVPV